MAADSLVHHTTRRSAPAWTCGTTGSRSSGFQGRSERPAAQRGRCQWPFPSALELGARPGQRHTRQMEVALYENPAVLDAAVIGVVSDARRRGSGGRGPEAACDRDRRRDPELGKHGPRRTRTRATSDWPPRCRSA